MANVRRAWWTGVLLSTATSISFSNYISVWRPGATGAGSWICEFCGFLRSFLLRHRRFPPLVPPAVGHNLFSIRLYGCVVDGWMFTCDVQPRERRVLVVLLRISIISKELCFFGKCSWADTHYSCLKCIGSLSVSPPLGRGAQGRPELQVTPSP